jgi:hypothetical protein
MVQLSDEEFNRLLRDWRRSIGSSLETIRDAEEKVLLVLTDQSQMERAILFMSTVIGRKELSMTSNTNIGTAGVAITGGTSHGDITGNVQQNLNSDIREALANIDQLRQKLLSSKELSETQKQDSGTALQDVDVELQKAPEQRNPSRIRNALNMLASVVKLVDGAQHAYDVAAPHIMSLIHHL